MMAQSGHTSSTSREQVAGGRGCPIADERQPDGSALLGLDSGGGGCQEQAGADQQGKQAADKETDAHGNLREAERKYADE